MSFCFFVNYLVIFWKFKIFQQIKLKISSNIQGVLAQQLTFSSHRSSFRSKYVPHDDDERSCKNLTSSLSSNRLFGRRFS